MKFETLHRCCIHKSRENIPGQGGSVDNVRERGQRTRQDKTGQDRTRQEDKRRHRLRQQRQRTWRAQGTRQRSRIAGGHNSDNRGRGQRLRPPVLFCPKKRGPATGPKQFEGKKPSKLLGIPTASSFILHLRLLIRVLRIDIPA